LSKPPVKDEDFCGLTVKRLGSTVRHRYQPKLVLSGDSKPNRLENKRGLEWYQLMINFKHRIGKDRTCADESTTSVVSNLKHLNRKIPASNAPDKLDVNRLLGRLKREPCRRRKLKNGSWVSQVPRIRRLMELNHVTHQD
jgi:hypothetical protein